MPKQLSNRQTVSSLFAHSKGLVYWTVHGTAQNCKPCKGQMTLSRIMVKEFIVTSLLDVWNFSHKTGKSWAQKYVKNKFLFTSVTAFKM